MSDEWYVARFHPVSLPSNLVPRRDDEARMPAPARYAARNLRDQGFQVYCPCVIDQVILRGKKQNIWRAVFPGYLFVILDIAQEWWRRARNTRGIKDFLPTHSETPQSVPDQFIERMRETETVQQAEEAVVCFSENAIVRILAGPFQGREGRVVQSRVGSTRVEIPLFGGREVPATVPTEDLILV